MDESDGLENRYGGNLIVGSNPTLSAILGTKLAQTSTEWSGPFPCNAHGLATNFSWAVFFRCEHYPPTREPYPGGVL